MVKLELAIENLKESLIIGGLLEDDALLSIEDFRTGLFIGNFEAISKYVFNNDISMMNNIVDGLSFSFLTSDLKTSFNNDIS